MALQPFQDEQLNYFKFASIVLNEFPKALRQTFRSMWDNNFGHLPGFQRWDDSIAVRNMFLNAEGGTTKVPTNLSYEEWDCTALFQATIYAQSFASPDSKGRHQTLSVLYVKPRKLAHGSFHASVVSPGGNKAETFALAIDQLRLLRNLLCHSSSSEIIRATFDQYVQHAKDAFKVLGVKTDTIDVIGGLNESDFPIKEVCKLEQAMKEETQAYIKFLESVITANNRQLEDMSSEIHELNMVLTKINEKLERDASKEDIHEMLLKEMKGQKLAPGKDTPGKYLFVIQLGNQRNLNLRLAVRVNIYNSIEPSMLSRATCIKMVMITRGADSLFSKVIERKKIVKSFSLFYGYFSRLKLNIKD